LCSIKLGRLMQSTLEMDLETGPNLDILAHIEA
jgi:hypothetical protein